MSNAKHPKIEGLPLTEKDEVDLAQLDAGPPSYHTILEVWLATLEPAAGLAGDRVTPTWANRICSTYLDIHYRDMNGFRDRLYANIAELLAILKAEIDTDAECLNLTTPEEDSEYNTFHYKNVLMNWQIAFTRWEQEWYCEADDAAIQIAALSEVYKMFFGEVGLTQHLDNIKFEFTEADQKDLTDVLEELKVEG